MVSVSVLYMTSTSHLLFMTFIQYSWRQKISGNGNNKRMMNLVVIKRKIKKSRFEKKINEIV